MCECLLEENGSNETSDQNFPDVQVFVTYKLRTHPVEPDQLTPRPLPPPEAPLRWLGEDEL
jgi:hypothetical protein